MSQPSRIGQKSQVVQAARPALCAASWLGDRARIFRRRAGAAATDELAGRGGSANLNTGQPVLSGGDLLAVADTVTGQGVVGPAVAVSWCGRPYRMVHRF